MIGFFPSLYPDEIFYSACARFHEQIQLPDIKSTARELFGSSNTLAVVDLPSHLNNFISNLPFGHCFDSNSLIDENTLFPFYAPFYPRSRLEKLRASMKEGSSSIHGQLGLMANTVPSIGWLKFCPICAELDKQLYSEHYWHRLHQIPGVEVCPTHKVFLENSKVQIRHRKNRWEFISAEKVIQPVLLRLLNPSNSSHIALLKIASDAAWLLEQRELAPGLDSFHKRYLYLLAERDFATYSGRVFVNKLMEAFICFYTPHLLNCLHCQVDSQSQHNWLFRLVRSPKNAQHPLHHLLLIHFLGHTAKSFFNLSEEFNPFGEGPWLCLNPMCSSYQAPSIKQYCLSYSQDTGRPVATFGCSCGFTYSRLGPDQSPKASYCFSRVEIYGAIWETALKCLWVDTTLSLREIARRFRVDSNTIKKHALRLNLPFPRFTKSPSPQALNSASLTKEQVCPNMPRQDVVLNREAWLLLRKTYPQAGSKFLRQQSPSTYTSPFKVLNPG